MDKVGIIERMRERNIKWDDIGYFLNATGDAARMCLKKKRDIEELGEKPIIKKSKFESAVASTSAQLRNGTIRRYKSADSFWWIFRDVLGMLLKIGFGTISRAGGQYECRKVHRITTGYCST